MIGRRQGSKFSTFNCRLTTAFCKEKQVIFNQKLINRFALLTGVLQPHAVFKEKNTAGCKQKQVIFNQNPINRVTLLIRALQPHTHKTIDMQKWTWV